MTQVQTLRQVYLKAVTLSIKCWIGVTVTVFCKTRDVLALGVNLYLYTKLPQAMETGDRPLTYGSYGTGTTGSCKAIYLVVL